MADQLEQRIQELLAAATARFCDCDGMAYCRHCVKRDEAKDRLTAFASPDTVALIMALLDDIENTRGLRRIEQSAGALRAALADALGVRA